MAAAWTVRSGNGELLAQYCGGSPQEVGRRIVPARYDAFRLQVSASYREAFERAVSKVLAQHGWQIVKVPARAARRPRVDHLALAA